MRPTGEPCEMAALRYCIMPKVVGADFLKRVVRSRLENPFPGSHCCCGVGRNQDKVAQRELGYPAMRRICITNIMGRQH